MAFKDPTEIMFKEIQNELSELKGMLLKKHFLNDNDLFCDNEEFIKIMRISRRTAQLWRDNGTIGFSQLGNKIYYKIIDIQELINQNYKQKSKL
jgi:hypothetical protein